LATTWGATPTSLFDIDHDQWTISLRKGDARHIRVSPGAPNLLSLGKFNIYQPAKMVDDDKQHALGHCRSTVRCDGRG